MIGIVDTNIIVDLIRNHPPALNWLEHQPTHGIPLVAHMEAVDGAANTEWLARTLAVLSRFEIVYLTQPDQEWAAEQHRRLRLSYGVHFEDCRIAAAAQRLNVPLYTHNLKHMQPLLGALAVAPY
ncbi:MAG: PIN domain-containing protein [Anaerolineae bacterium]